MNSGYVRAWKSYRTYFKNSEVLGRYTNVEPVPVPSPGSFYKGIPVPRRLCHGRTELTEVPGTGMNVVELTQIPGAGMNVQKLHNFRVRVWMSGRIYRRFGTGNTRQNTLVWFCT